MSIALRSLFPALLAATALSGCGGGTEIRPLAFSAPSVTMAVSGSPRRVMLTNNGPMAIEQLQITTEGFPGGTTAYHSCPQRLLPKASCGVMLLPGDKPSAAPGDTAPRPATVRASGTGAPPATVAVAVITHGSVHGGGYVFSIDDRTPIDRSVGGKVAALADLPGTHVWSPAEGAIGVSGIDIAGPDSCDGAIDGECNTARIVARHGSGSYAAALCAQSTQGGHDNWYLPALCELGYDTHDVPGNFCGSAQQPRLADNIRSRLVDRSPTITPFQRTYNWSSTERAGDPDRWALGTSQLLQDGFGGGSKVSHQLLVRCARRLTP